MCSPNFRRPPPWEQSIYINDLEFFCMGAIRFLPYLFYSITYYCISMNHGYLFSTLGYNPIQLYLSCCSHLFSTLGYNPIQFYLSCCSHCLSFGHWELPNWFLCPFDISSSMCFDLCVCVCVCVCAHSLTFWHYKILQAFLAERITISSIHRTFLMPNIWGFIELSNSDTNYLELAKTL